MGFGQGVSAAVAAALIAGCATRPENIAARYVSPVGYRGLVCEQLFDEARRLRSEGRAGG